MESARPNTVGNELWAILPSSPDAYLQKLDLVRGVGLVVRLDDRAYRGASFLDDRILSPSTQGSWFNWQRLEEAAQRIQDPRPLHFIFHTGHVGSTLVSRLLQFSGSILSIREPLPLRTLAEAWDSATDVESLLSPSQLESLLALVEKLWRRGYASTRAVIVKATSTAGRFAVPVMRASPDSRAIYLNLTAETYLAALLAGSNSAEDLRGHAPNRMHRLRARSRGPLTPVHALSLGELAALGWLTETLSQREALQAFPDRVLALDFDRFLTDVDGSMSRTVAHFGLTVDSRYLAGIGTSSPLQEYSKAPERPFSPEERTERLRESRTRNRDEIAKGMAWLENMSRQEPELAKLFDAAETH